MIRSLLSVSALALLGACATTDVTDMPPLNDSDFTEAIFVEDARMPEMPEPVEVEQVAPPAQGQFQPVRTTSTRRTVPAPVSPQTAIQQGASQARIEPSIDGYVNAIQVYPYTEGALYRLYSAPGQVSDIALQPGETLVSVSAGDTVRWVVGDTISGSGASARSHVLVKPINAGLHTNLMIATDRRTYHLELESSDGAYMAALSWRYPQDEMRELQSRRARENSRLENTIESNLSLANLNCDYRIEGDRPNWKPVRVFDDGRQVFIQMPADIATTDAPPLFVIGSNGNAELVNYRMRGRYYVVDHLFRAAELRLGTKPQTIVRITKGAARSGLAALFGG